MAPGPCASTGASALPPTPCVTPVRRRCERALHGASAARVQAAPEHRMPDGVDAALDLGFDLRLRRALEDGDVDVADADDAALVAERHELVELVDLQRGIGLLVEVDRDRVEADVDEVFVDLVRGAADVDRD